MSVTTQIGAAQPSGTGCGSNPAPVLSSNVPRIGTQFNLQLTNGGPSLSGYLIAAGGLGAPFVIPGGCSIVLDVAVFDLIPITISPTGFWALAVPVPNDPQLVCGSKSVQAAILNVGTGTWRTSQALSLTIGP